jgi:tetratricopeptide (TPR) repeat protein
VSKKAVETNPRALTVRAMVHSRKRQHNEALALMNKILEPTLKDEDLRPDKAIVLYNASRFAEAERLCKNILSNPVSNMEKRRATRLMAKIHEVHGKVDEALRLNLEILPYEQEDDFKMNLVKLYDRKGDRGNALRYLTLLRDKKVKAAEIEKRLNTALAAKDPKAVEYFSKYSGHLDRDAPFIVEAARYMVTNGKKLEGFTLLRKAEKGLAGGDAALYHAELLINDGKYVEAQRLLTPLMVDNRYFVRSSYLLAEVLKREGDKNRAIAVLARAVQHTKDRRVSAALAELYATTGDRKNALKYYLSAAEKGDALATVKAADLFYLTGDYAKAQQYYKRALASNLSDPGTLQWTYYQYGKLAGDREHLKKAAASGGVVGEAAEIIAGEESP